MLKVCVCIRPINLCKFMNWLKLNYFFIYSLEQPYIPIFSIWNSVHLTPKSSLQKSCSMQSRESLKPIHRLNIVKFDGCFFFPSYFLNFNFIFWQICMFCMFNKKIPAFGKGKLKCLFLWYSCNIKKSNKLQLFFNLIMFFKD